MDAIPSELPSELKELPSDPQALRAIIHGLHQQLQQRESALELCDLHIEQIRQQAQDLQAQVLRQAQEQAKLIEQVKAEAQRQIDLLKQQHQAELQALLRRFYGPRSERFDPCQLLLFGEMMEPAELPAPAPTPAPAEAAAALASRPGVVRKGLRDPHGRGQLPAHLPRVQVLHDLPEPAKAGLVKIGEVITEQLEYQVAKLFVLQHVQCKYALPPAQQAESAGIVLAEKPIQPIAKGLPGPGLLAYLITSKLADHLPLYRLEQIFARSGVQIGRSTLCGWMGACGDLVKPLTDLMAQQVKQSRVIHTDDTKVPVQDQPGQCKSGRLWGYAGDPAHPYDVYDYTPDRSKDGPHAWLQGYAGYLQADAYGVYDGAYAGGKIREVACWAHARRKFYDALETDRERCTAMLRMIQELYQVEREAAEKGLDEAAIAALRQQKSVPVLAKIKAWLEQEKQIVLPRSAVGLAIQYCLNQWDALCVYTTQGFLAIDNNAAERAMKPVAMGRKNWLFAGNDQAAVRMARLLTLVQSAKRHGLDVQRYLGSVLAKLAGTPVSELEQFLPQRWKAEDAAEPWPALPSVPSPRPSG